MEQSSFIKDVIEERRRQVEEHGFDAEHDDSYKSQQLVDAAEHYIRNGHLSAPTYGWPWSTKWWKPEDGRTNLIKAIALLIAEGERRDRLEASQSELVYDVNWVKKSE